MDVYVGCEFSVAQVSLNENYVPNVSENFIDVVQPVNSMCQYRERVFYSFQQLCSFSLEEVAISGGRSSLMFDNITDHHPQTHVEKLYQLSNNQPTIYSFDSHTRNISIWNVGSSERYSLLYDSSPSTVLPTLSSPYSTTITCLQPITKSRLGIGYNDGSMVCWNLEKGQKEYTLTVHPKGTSYENFDLMEDEKIHLSKILFLTYDDQRKIITSCAHEDNAIVLWSSNNQQHKAIHRIDLDFVVGVTSVFQIPRTPHLIVGDEQGGLCLMDFRKLYRRVDEDNILDSVIWKSFDHTVERESKPEINNYCYDERTNLLATTTFRELCIWDMSMITSSSSPDSLPKKEEDDDDDHNTNDPLLVCCGLFDSEPRSVLIVDETKSPNSILSRCPKEEIPVIKTEIAVEDVKDELVRTRNSLQQIAEDVRLADLGLQNQKVQGENLIIQKRELRKTISRKKKELVDVSAKLKFKILRSKGSQQMQIQEIFDRHELEIQRKIEEIQHNICERKREEIKHEIILKKRRVHRARKRIRRLEKETKMIEAHSTSKSSRKSKLSLFSHNNKRSRSSMFQSDLKDLDLIRLVVPGAREMEKLKQKQRKLGEEIEQLHKVNKVLLNPELVNFVYGNSDRDTFVRGYLGFKIIERLASDARAKKEIRFLEEVFADEEKRKVMLLEYSNKNDEVSTSGGSVSNENREQMFFNNLYLQMTQGGIETKYFPRYFGWWKERKRWPEIEEIEEEGEENDDDNDNNNIEDEEKRKSLNKMNDDEQKKSGGGGLSGKRPKSMRKKAAKKKKKRKQRKRKNKLKNQRLSSLGPGIPHGLTPGGPGLPPSQPYVYKLIIEKNVDTLENFVHVNSVKLSTVQKVKLIVECAKIIDYFHQNDMVYGSIHPKNFLIYNNTLEETIKKNQQQQQQQQNLEQHTTKKKKKKKRLTLKLFDFRNVQTVPFVVRKIFGYPHFQDPTISQLIGLEDHDCYGRDVYSFICLIYYIFFPSLLTHENSSNNNDNSSSSSNTPENITEGSRFDFEGVKQYPFHHILCNIIFPFYDTKFDVKEFPFLMYNICVGMNQDYNTGILFLEKLHDLRRATYVPKQKNTSRSNNAQQAAAQLGNILLSKQDEDNVSELLKLIRETKNSRSYFTLLKAGRTRVELEQIPKFLLSLMELGMNFVSRKRPDMKTLIRECCKYIKDNTYEGSETETIIGEQNEQKNKVRNHGSQRDEEIESTTLNWDNPPSTTKMKNSQDIPLKTKEDDDDDDEEDTNPFDDDDDDDDGNMSSDEEKKEGEEEEEGIGKWNEEKEREKIDLEFQLQRLEYLQQSEYHRFKSIIDLIFYDKSSKKTNKSRSNNNNMNQKKKKKKKGGEKEEEEEENEDGSDLDDIPIQEWGTKHVLMWLRYHYFKNEMLTSSSSVIIKKNKCFSIYSSCFKNVRGDRLLTITDEFLHDYLKILSKSHREQILNSLLILKRRGKFVKSEIILYEKLRRYEIMNRINILRSYLSPPKTCYSEIMDSNPQSYTYKMQKRLIIKGMMEIDEMNDRCWNLMRIGQVLSDSFELQNFYLKYDQTTESMKKQEKEFDELFASDFINFDRTKRRQQEREIQKTRRRRQQQQQQQQQHQHEEGDDDDDRKGILLPDDDDNANNETEEERDTKIWIQEHKILPEEIREELKFGGITTESSQHENPETTDNNNNNNEMKKKKKSVVEVNKIKINPKEGPVDLPVQLILSEGGQLIWSSQSPNNTLITPWNEIIHPICTPIFQNIHSSSTSSTTTATTTKKFCDVRLGVVIGPWYLEYNSDYNLCVPKLLSPELSALLLNRRSVNLENNPFIFKIGSSSSNNLTMEQVIIKICKVVNRYNTCKYFANSLTPLYACKEDERKNAGLEFIRDLFVELGIVEDRKQLFSFETSITNFHQTSSSALVEYLSFPHLSLEFPVSKVFNVAFGLNDHPMMSSGNRKFIDFQEKGGGGVVLKHSEMDKFLQEVVVEQTGVENLIRNYPDENAILESFDRLMFLNQFFEMVVRRKKRRKRKSRLARREDQEGVCPLGDIRDMKNSKLTVYC